jgi:hypothetical protein
MDSYMEILKISIPPDITLKTEFQKSASAAKRILYNGCRQRIRLAVVALR